MSRATKIERAVAKAIAASLTMAAGLVPLNLDWEAWLPEARAAIRAYKKAVKEKGR